MLGYGAVNGSEQFESIPGPVPSPIPNPVDAFEGSSSDGASEVEQDSSGGAVSTEQQLSDIPANIWIPIISVGVAIVIVCIFIFAFIAHRRRKAALEGLPTNCVAAAAATEGPISLVKRISYLLCPDKCSNSVPHCTASGDKVNQPEACQTCPPAHQLAVSTGSDSGRRQCVDVDNRLRGPQPTTAKNMSDAACLSAAPNSVDPRVDFDSSEPATVSFEEWCSASGRSGSYTGMDASSRAAYFNKDLNATEAPGCQLPPAASGARQSALNQTTSRSHPAASTQTCSPHLSTSGGRPQFSAAASATAADATATDLDAASHLAKEHSSDDVLDISATSVGGRGVPNPAVEAQVAGMQRRAEEVQQPFRGRATLELSAEQSVLVVKKIGEGAFGSVWQGELCVNPLSLTGPTRRHAAILQKWCDRKHGAC